MEHSIEELRKVWVGEHDIAPEDFLVLVLFVLQMSRTEFSKEASHVLSDEQLTTLTALLERRKQSEPVAYLTGHKEFYGRDFCVTSATLIPRPDSECIIEDVLEFYKGDTEKPYSILDIGTGSGALAITLSCELSDSSINIYASDISPAALEVAKKNSALHNTNITFLEGSLLEPYQKLSLQNEATYIVANLPYVSEKLFSQTEPDVQNFEPKSALWSDDNGLAHYKILLHEVKKIAPWKRLTVWLEISPEQAEVLTAYIYSLFPEAVVYVGHDLSGKKRLLRFTI